VVVALADKLETLVGLFGIGQAPSGDKDPFALRRHALGVIRLLIEKSLALDLDWLVEEAVASFRAPNSEVTDGSGTTARHFLLQDTAQAVAVFIYERLAGMLRDQGYAAQEIDAVLALQPQRFADIAMRLAAVRSFSSLPESASLAAANKRVGNILRKVEGTVEPTVVESLLREPAESALNRALATVRPGADAAFQRGDYAASLQAWAALKAPVDAFFDNVMVNVDDHGLRANRLGLLAQLHSAMNRVADLSKLAG
jgi:glycyl-tRNA synthetase beta chain